MPGRDGDGNGRLQEKGFNLLIGQGMIWRTVFDSVRKVLEPGSAFLSAPPDWGQGRARRAGAVPALALPGPGRGGAGPHYKSREAAGAG